MPGGGGGGEVFPGYPSGIHPFRLAATRQSTFPVEGKDSQRNVP